MRGLSSNSNGTGKDVLSDQNLLDTGVTMTEAVEVLETLRRRFPIKFDVSTRFSTH